MGKLFLQHFDGKNAYTWDLTCGTQLNFMMTWNTLFKNNAYMWDQSWFMTPLTWRKCLHVGPWKNL
jgi:hypothetical protein